MLIGKLCSYSINYVKWMLMKYDVLFDYTCTFQILDSEIISTIYHILTTQNQQTALKGH